jgi:multidrug efflux pump
MTLPSLSLKRPVLAIVMSIVIVLFGVIGFKFLGVREYPSIDPPTITVRTNYTGANSDVIETQITEPIEKAVNGIEGIRTISSSSNQGSSKCSRHSSSRERWNLFFCDKAVVFLALRKRMLWLHRD